MKSPFVVPRRQDDLSFASSPKNAPTKAKYGTARPRDPQALTCLNGRLPLAEHTLNCSPSAWVKNHSCLFPARHAKQIQPGDRPPSTKMERDNPVFGSNSIGF